MHNDCTSHAPRLSARPASVFETAASQLAGFSTVRCGSDANNLLRVGKIRAPRHVERCVLGDS